MHSCRRSFKGLCLFVWTIFPVACIPFQSGKKDKDKPVLEAQPEELGLIGRNGVGTGGGSDCKTSDGDRGSVANHLFTLREACQAEPLVLAEDRSVVDKPPEGSIDPDYLDWMRYTEDFVNKGMKLKELKPGRDFRIYAYDDDEFNASARGDLYFNTGLIKEVDSLSMATIICHEISHETRNHGVTIDRIIKEIFDKDNPKLQRVEALMEPYMDKQFSETAGTYHHVQREFEPLRSAWMDLQMPLSMHSRRLEAEADAVGAKICGKFGFSQSEVERGFGGFLDGDLKHGGAQVIEDGTYRLKGMEPLDFMIMVLMNDVATHPTPTERLAQIKRILPAVSSTKQEIASTWSGDYDRKFPPKGLALVASPVFGSITELLLHADKPKQKLQERRKDFCPYSHMHQNEILAGLKQRLKKSK